MATSPIVRVTSPEGGTVWRVDISDIMTALPTNVTPIRPLLDDNLRLKPESFPSAKPFALSTGSVTCQAEGEVETTPTNEEGDLDDLKKMKASIEGTFLSILQKELAEAMPGMVWNETDDAINIGSGTDIPEYAYIFIGRQKDGKPFIFILYRATLKGALAFNVGEGEQSKPKLTINGKRLLERALGDQYFRVYRQKT